MNLSELNALDADSAANELLRCCGSQTWASQMAESRPFETLSHLYQQADAIWAACSEPDFLEAFSHHPKIGDMDQLEKKFAATAKWSEGEQGTAVDSAPRTVLEALKAGNEAYDTKNGFIFIVCASGKSASEMLALLNARMPNSRTTELANAAEEQRKITRLRLEKLLEQE